MIRACVVLTQYQHVTDGKTDTPTETVATTALAVACITEPIAYWNKEECIVLITQDVYMPGYLDPHAM